MREEHYWPAWDSDPAEQKAAPQAFSAYPSSDPYDELRDHSEDDQFVDELLAPEVLARPKTRATRFRRGVGRAFMIAGGAAFVFVILYVADLVVSVGDVPRGVTVAGVEVGGLSRSEAEDRLRTELGPRMTEPIDVRAGDVRTSLPPGDAGLALDWQGTVQQAGNQPLDPWTRITSFFTTREVGIVSSADDDVLKGALQDLAKSDIDRDVVEGTIGFHPVGDDSGAGRVEPYVIEPKQGQRLGEIHQAMDIVKRSWLNGGAVRLPVGVTPTKVSSEGVRTALEQTVEPMVSGPVTVHGDGKDAELRPRDISEALRFAPGDKGNLRVTLDPQPLQRAVAPQLASTERDPKDAQLTFTGSSPSIEPSVQGRTIDWAGTFAPFVEVAKRDEGRELDVSYSVTDPETTTQEAKDLGIKEVVGEFSASDVSGPAVTNVATMAAAVNGTIVRPGETFSLDGTTGARTASQGYVSAPVNEDGTGRSVVGGGVSALTTTLYNAAYFAGLADAGHTAHTHYLDRYPAGRDAASLREDGSNADLSFRNTMDKGVAVQAIASGSGVTVKLWGTKQFRVESGTSDFKDVKAPGIDIRRGAGCEPSAGTSGFTVTDTRVVYEAKTGRKVTSDSSTATYSPVDTVICRGSDDHGGDNADQVNHRPDHRGGRGAEQR